MDWKEQCITEYRATIEQADRERREREAQEREQRVRAFGDKLRKLLGVEVRPTGLETTVDGVTFTLISAEQENRFHVIKVVETCPECAQKILSPPIGTRAALGEWLSRDSLPEHPCRTQPVRETPQPGQSAPMSGRR